MMRRALVLLLALAALAAGQTVVVGREAPPDKASWGLCSGLDCTVKTNATVPYIVVGKFRFSSCWAVIKTAPTGADLVLDIHGASGASIFGAGAKLTITAGQTSGVISTFAAPDVDVGDTSTIDITQVGSTIAGKDLAVSCKLVAR